MSAPVEEGTILRVTMEVRLPRAASPKDISEWLSHNVGRCGSMSCDSPLYPHEPEVWAFGDVEWIDTGATGRTEEFDRKDLGGGRSTSRLRMVRRRKSPVVPIVR